MHYKNLNSARITCMLFATLFLFALAGVTNVYANDNLNHLLQGDYAFSQTIHCILNLDGFVGDNNQLPEGGSEGSIQNLSVEGIFHFNGDGTASYESTELTISHNATSPGSYPVGSSDSHCDFTYNVNQNRSFNRGSTVCTGTIQSGSPLAVGKAFSLTAEQFGNGQIGVGNQILLLSGTDESIQNVTIPDFLPGWDLSFDRICNHTGTAVRLP